MSAANRLKSLIERAERIIEERKAIQGDLRDLFLEAKGVGYNPKIMRRVIAERARDAAELAAEQDELDTYRHALGMAVELVRDGLSLRDAQKKTGVSKSSIHRALAVPKPSQPASQGHDPQTGEITSPASGEESCGPDTTSGDTGSYPVVRDSGLPQHDACSTNEQSKPRSPAPAASDSTEPVEVTRKDTWAGERGPGIWNAVADPELQELLVRAKAAVDAMSPEEREAMYAAQRESYVRGEMGMGDDADEAEYRRRMAAGLPLYDTPSGAPPTDGVGAVAEAQPERVASTNSDEDDLVIPAFLRRIPV